MEGDRYPEQYDARFEISIHALRVEGDSMREVVTLKEYYISIHALRVEGDRTDRPQAPRKAEFLSTPSGWRATVMSGMDRSAAEISIHALRVEGDLS